MKPDDGVPPILFVTVPALPAKTKAESRKATGKRIHFEENNTEKAKKGEDDGEHYDYEDEDNPYSGTDYDDIPEEAAKMVRESPPLPNPVAAAESSSSSSSDNQKASNKQTVVANRLPIARIIGAAMKGAGVVPVLANAVSFWSAHNNGQAQPEVWE
jgi:hypothetical protein